MRHGVVMNPVEEIMDETAGCKKGTPEYEIPSILLDVLLGPSNGFCDNLKAVFRVFDGVLRCHTSHILLQC
jgi:hypothetical protein